MSFEAASRDTGLSARDVVWSKRQPAVARQRKHIMNLFIPTDLTLLRLVILIHFRRDILVANIHFVN